MSQTELNRIYRRLIVALDSTEFIFAHIIIQTALPALKLSDVPKQYVGRVNDCHLGLDLYLCPQLTVTVPKK